MSADTMTGYDSNSVKKIMTPTCIATYGYWLPRLANYRALQIGKKVKGQKESPRKQQTVISGKVL